MDELCSACLCDGRNLYLIENTAFYHLYLQILNEIQVYDAAMCIRVCWECRALLQRFQQFKTQVRQSYAELLHHIQQNTPKFSLRKPSRLTVHSTVSISWPQPGGDVKLEQEVPGDEVKIKTEVEEHCEPESFVNGLEIDLKYEGEKISKKKTKKKLKSNKKKKKLKQPIENTSDGFSDREAYEQDELENTKLDNHIQDVENAGTEESTYICSRCGLPFKNKGSFDAHVKSEHSKVVLSKPESNLPRPRSKEVLAEKPECTECGKVFSSRKTYRYHLNVLHKGQNRYPCPRCGKVYQWKSNLGRHLRTHKARDDGELYCELCDKPFASVATYRQHLRVSRRHVSESEFSFVCGECGKKFVNKTRLRDHVDWEHLKKIKFRCQLCNKPFKCHTSLYVHMQNVHRNKEKKDNLCHVCGKSYQNAAKLKYHIVAMHTTETPYQCGQCAAAFGWYSSLYRHIREVHYKMKVQPKKSKKCKKLPEEPPPMPLAAP